jgi:hypothetical protein
MAFAAADLGKAMLKAVRFLVLRVGSCALIAGSPAFAAGGPEDPVKGVYAFAKLKRLDAPYMDAQLRLRFFTAAFRAVAESIDRREAAANGEILDSDPIDAANGPVDEANLVVRVERTQGDRAIVKATFGSPQWRRAALYDVVKESGVWRIDDITDVPDKGSDPGWSVRKISDDDLAQGKK